jgi:N-acetylmuramoyl-L-alanine amidase
MRFPPLRPLVLLAAMLAAAASAAQAPASSGSLGFAAAAENLKARISFDPLTGSGIVERSGLRASFAVDVPFVLLEWDQTIAVEAPRNAPEGLVFPASTVSALASAFGSRESELASQYSVAAILIDPGHGGKDPGAIGEHQIGGKKLRVVEKDIALAVAQTLHAKLRDRFPDRKIFITRKGDTYPSLEDRVEMANAVELTANEAIIYVSIHANAAFNKNARGFEVWYLNPEYRRKLVDPGAPGGPSDDIAPILNAMLEEEFTTESIILARSIVTSLQSTIGAQSPSRGVKAEEWFVVRNARMPSVLVEMGYITNLDEAKLLATEDYLREIAEGIYTGIVDFIGYFEGMKGAPAP